MRNLLFLSGSLLLLASPGISFADSFTIETDATWRVIAPVGNLAGQPINNVGLAWQAANVGWNSSLSFDDSNAAGWQNSVFLGVDSGFPLIWVSDIGLNAPTPNYFRKSFTINGTPTSGLLSINVDDDAQVYLNGNLVINDANGVNSILINVNVSAFLQPGTNLLAVKAHDSFGVSQHFGLRLTGDFTAVPEPGTLALGLAVLGGGGVAAWRRRRMAEVS